MWDTRASTPEGRYTCMTDTAEKNFPQRKALGFQVEEGYWVPRTVYENTSTFLKNLEPWCFTIRKILRSFCRRKPDYIKRVKRLDCFYLCSNKVDAVKFSSQLRREDSQQSSESGWIINYVWKSNKCFRCAEGIYFLCFSHQEAPGGSM